MVVEILRIPEKTFAERESTYREDQQIENQDKYQSPGRISREHFTFAPHAHWI